MGTTSEKLTYLNTTKTLIKDNLNLGGANISNEPFRAYKDKLEGIYKDFLANGTDTLWNNWEKVSGSGTEISLNNTIEAKMDFVYKGNTSQTGTPTPSSPIDVQVVSGDNTIKVEGKNLFDLSTLFKNKFGGNTTSDKGITFTNNNGTINLNGTSTGTAECIIGGWNGPAHLIELDSSQTYTLKIFGKEKSGNTVVCGVDIRGIKNGSASKIIYGSDNTDTIELTGWSSIVYIDIYTQYTSGAINKNISIQLVKGSTIPTTYTPYVSQSYPISLGTIELCKIGNYQDKIAKSSGKNLFNKDSANIIQNKYLNDSGDEINDNNFFISDYIKVDANTVYSSQPFENKSACICFYNSSKTFLSSKKLTQIQPNFTTPNNCEYIRVSIWKADINIIQIEKGSSSSSYEPYGKVWYLNKQIGKVVLNGSESDWHTSGLSVTGYKSYYVGSSVPLTFVDSGKCNYFEFKSYNDWIGLLEATFIEITYQSIGIRVVETLAPTLEDFKTWLSTHNTIAYFVLATPTTEEITNSTLISQLEALNGAKSYTTQTNISQENNDKPFILDVTALKQLTIEEI